MLAMGGLGQIGRVRVPDASEVDALVFELHHGRDHRGLGQPLELRVFHGLAEAPGEGQLFLWGELLVAEEDDEVVEEGATDLGDQLVGERCRELHAADLGAERAGHGQDFDVMVGATGGSGHRLSFLRQLARDSMVPSLERAGSLTQRALLTSRSSRQKIWLAAGSEDEIRQARTGRVERA